MKELHVSFVCLPDVLGSNKDYLNLNLNLNLNLKVTLNWDGWALTFNSTPLVPHICVSGSALAQIMACRLFGASYYLNQCWNIVNWTLRNKLQLIFNQNTKLFIHENAFENIVCEINCDHFVMGERVKFFSDTYLSHQYNGMNGQTTVFGRTFWLRNIFWYCSWPFAIISRFLWRMAHNFVLAVGSHSVNPLSRNQWCLRRHQCRHWSGATV